MCVLLLLAGAAAADTSGFEILRYPGAAETFPQDIHDGLIVGHYRNAAGDIHGFVYDGSTYSTLDFPGSGYTAILGTDGTNIVGAYYGPESRQQGFLFDGNRFTTIAPPDTTTTIFNGATANGVDGQTIVGSYYDTFNRASAFIFDGSTYRGFGLPTQGTDVPHDIDDGKIVGFFLGPGRRQGFFFDGQATLELSHPDAGPFGTEATGVSGNRVVGFYYEGSPPVKHSFIYERGEYRTYDVPASLGDDTEIRGIHGDKIVGYYIGTSGGYHGFVATIPEPHTLQLLAAICLSSLMVRRSAICVLVRRGGPRSN